MNHEQELKLQAWLDGEMPPHEASRFEEELITLPDARPLIESLKSAKSALQGNELARPLGETREFYWSQIRRRIEQAPRQPQTASPWLWLARWRRYLVPAMGAAFVFVLVMNATFHSEPVMVPDETADTASGIEATTFHDQAEGITIVWLQNTPQLAMQSDAPINEEVP
jgi:anti-sigma factor RsiW